MLFIFYWLIVAYGMSTIIVYGSIFSTVREGIKKRSKFFGDLISCMLCTSTWVGFFLSICFGGMMGSPHFFPLNLLFDGCFTAGGVWAINAVVEWFEENRPNKSQIL